MCFLFSESPYLSYLGICQLSKIHNIMISTLFAFLSFSDSTDTWLFITKYVVTEHINSEAEAHEQT